MQNHYNATFSLCCLLLVLLANTAQTVCHPAVSPSPLPATMVDDTLPSFPDPYKSLAGKNHHNNMIIVYGTPIALVIVTGILIWHLMYNRPQNNHPHDIPTQHALNIHDFLQRTSPCRRILFSKIQAATNNFDDASVIGTGGLGKVYRGQIDGVEVAIKRASHQGLHQFETGVELLTHRVSHRNLVSLIGYCINENELILVYPYMACGTLYHSLHSARKPLTWLQRLDICVGAARGLYYLHTGTTVRIIHRGIKSSNILLDERWDANVSDFGISKLNPLDESHVVNGTFGYLDPEYFQKHDLTMESDVYSFGVVLLECLSGRHAVNMQLPTEEQNLANWAQECHINNNFDDIIDPSLLGKISPASLQIVKYTILKSTNPKGSERPSMVNVMCSLEHARHLQQTAEERNVGGTS